MIESLLSGQWVCSSHRFFMDEQAFSSPTSLGVAQIRGFREFRESWTTWGPLTHIKYIERLRACYRFALQNKWVRENSIAFLKPPRHSGWQVFPGHDPIASSSW